MLTRGYYVMAAAATAVLTAASVAAIAAPGAQGHDRYVAGRPTAGQCTIPARLPGQRVTVMLTDMPGNGGMMPGYGAMMGGRTMMLRAFPRVVAAGTVSLVAINHGTRTHELVVLPLTHAATVGARVVRPDNTVSEVGSLGEASNSCGPGAGDGIRRGSASWVTISLAPGRYELVCNLRGHYAAGMYAELDVD